MPNNKQSWLKSETIQLALLILGAVSLVALLTKQLTASDAVTATIALLAALIRLLKGKDA